MNISFIKFLSSISQKILIAITTNLIYKLIKDILLWIFLIIVIIIIGLVIIHYSGIYDVYEFLVDKFPIIENIVNTTNTKFKIA